MDKKSNRKRKTIPCFMISNF